MFRRNRGEEPLDRAIEAIALDDSRALRKILDEGLDPDATDSSGAPLLFFCAEGRIQCALLLLERGARVSNACPDGTTAPMRAARACPTCLQAFARDASVWLQEDKSGQNILHHGCMGVSRHARISLSWAAEHAPERLFRSRNTKGLTPLELACRFDNLDSLLCVLPRSEAFEPNPRTGLTPLSQCLEDGKAACAGALWRRWSPAAEADLGEETIKRAMACVSRHPGLMGLIPLFASAERGLIESSTEEGKSSSGAKSL